MRLSSRTPRQAIAMVIVMVSIFVLSMLAAGFAYSMKVETRLARNANNEAELEWLGRSGVEYARWILIQQLSVPNEGLYDALNQVWAGGPGGIGTSNSPLANVMKEVELGNGSFTWKITDLESRININTLPGRDQFFQQTLLSLGLDASQVTPVMNSIADWIDTDDDTRIQGAERSFYESQDPPYQAKNGPIDDLSELLLVNGVTPELYYGISSTNYQPGAAQPRFNRSSNFGPMDIAPFPVGFVDVFTPFSIGKININTASADVLQCVPGLDRTMAETIISGREGEDDGSGLLGPYRRVQDLGRVGIPFQIIRQLEPYCDVRSRTFKVEIDARINNYTRQFVAILGRTPPRDIQVLSFYWK
jgi:type II secretory pathway component PulK